MTTESISALHVMGHHWLPDLSGLTALGRLVSQAKDHADPEADEQLCEMLASFVSKHPALLAHPSRSDKVTLVVAVPPNPETQGHLALRLAAAAAATLDLPIDHELLIRHHATRRMRDTEPARRQAEAELAGYEVTRPLEGASVLLVDDVIMTGTTLRHLADLLVVAGASRVEAVVASRTTRLPTK